MEKIVLSENAVFCDGFSWGDLSLQKIIAEILEYKTRGHCYLSKILVLADVNWDSTLSSKLATNFLLIPRKTWLTSFPFFVIILPLFYFFPLWWRSRITILSHFARRVICVE